MQKVKNPFQACQDIFLKPNRVFYTIAQTNNWSWFPFLIVMAMSLLPGYVYFNNIDFGWYQDFIINSQFAEVSPSEQNTVRANLTKENVIGGNLMVVFFGSVLINAIIAVYLNYATKVDEHNLHGFTDWYGFTWWISMPLLVGSVLSLLILLISNGEQMEPTVLGVTSLAYWFAVDMQSKWYTLLMTIRLDSFWSMYLCAVGISQWTQIGTNKCYFIAIAPSAFIWSIWLLFLIF